MSYTGIPDTDIDPGSPVDTTLIGRLRDDPIGAMAGDDGAYRLYREALNSEITAGGVIQWGLDSGSVYEFSGPNVVRAGAPLNCEFSVPIMHTGTIRVRAQFSKDGAGSGTATLTVYRYTHSAGALVSSVVGSDSTTSGSYKQFSLDVAVAFGDVITMTANSFDGSGGSNTVARVRNFGLLTDGGKLFPTSNAQLMRGY